MSPAIDFHAYKLEKIRDPEYAKEYLRLALEDSRKENDRQLFLLALRDVVEAQGGIPALAPKIDMPKRSLYKAISENGNPRFHTLEKILDGLGLRLSVESAR
ncbi:MAG: transcriptional regulator [Candidatus Omnitrophota bacterium]